MATNCERKNAAIIIIGDEILKGQTQDTNTHFLAGNLRRLGVSLERVSVIPDDVTTIAEEVRRFSHSYTFVLTSGGIGPTHDDLTYEGVARAFDDSLQHNPKLVELCKTWFKKEDLEDPCFKLALLPSTAKLNFGIDQSTGKPSFYPLVSVKNVFIFPGIPGLLHRAFNNLGRDLFGTDRVFIFEELFFTQDEVSITSQLNRLVRDNPEVTFGSYPSLTSQFYRTKLTMEASTSGEVEGAKAQAQELKPVRFDPNPTQGAWDKIQTFLTDSQDQRLSQMVEDSLRTVEECFTKYDPDSVAVCYNGGKDCIVMLHLVHAFHQKHFPGKRLKAFYVSELKTFPEVDRFMADSVTSYSLQHSVYREPMKTALSVMMAEDRKIQATILGVREGDPGSRELGSFTPTDGDWPRVMRVHPILRWGYRDIWTFLRGLSLPYPVLYDQGYTSLGNPENTVPNPALAYLDPLGEERFLPAYHLKDPAMERKGRL